MSHPRRLTMGCCGEPIDKAATTQREQHVKNSYPVSQQPSPHPGLGAPYQEKFVSPSIPSPLFDATATLINGDELPSSPSQANGFFESLVPLKLNSAEMCIGDYCALPPPPPSVPSESSCSHEERYRPAYELLDGSLERAGRVSNPSNGNGTGAKLQT